MGNLDRGSFLSIVLGVVVSIALGAGLVLGTLTLAKSSQPATDFDIGAQTIRTRFGSVQIDHDLDVFGDMALGDATPDTTLNGEDFFIEGTLEVDGATNFDGAADFASTVAVASSLNAAADVDVGTWLNLSAQAVVVVANNGAITPTGTYQVITSTAVVTTDTTLPIATSGFETGDLLILRNANAADTIAIDGTGGSVECKADVVLGASDTLTLIFNGTVWNCLANYDNS